MSGDWQTDGEEFSDRMMEKMRQTARVAGDGVVEVEFTEEMVGEVLAEMGVCDRCGLKRTHRANCPNRRPHD